ncbi:PREDICTED: sorting nexin-16 isoform X5 [Myotis brandtii]|uniref:sorting nexin-16 isoform X5 n=1 Tax=Myotis brandtii TaxID=109478 RepID=UPI000703DA29|nr:PREDICTED: sorting nexin-16 isoform X5 [Myotis brandtii]
MATPYVPVPMPIGSSASSFTTSRNQRSSSLGSLSTSSNSSKGQLEDSNTGTRKQTSAPGQRDSASSVCSSPLLRTKFTNADSCTRPRESEEQNPETANLEDRPSTPTILGYEVMEERAKFTVYKIQVKKNPEESWVVFRRYTDFSRLNDKAFCETLEDTNYRFQKELLEKQKEVESLKKLLERCVQTPRIRRTGQAPKASVSRRWRRLRSRLSQKSRLESAELVTSRAAVSASPKPARRRWKWQKWPTILRRTEPRGAPSVSAAQQLPSFPTLKNKKTEAFTENSKNACV